MAAFDPKRTLKAPPKLTGLVNHLVCTKTIQESEMILRRLATALREQNWFTVALEILIVVVGSFRRLAG